MGTEHRGAWQNGPFIRLKAGEPELVVGQWALIGVDALQVNHQRSDFSTVVEHSDQLGAGEDAHRLIDMRQGFGERLVRLCHAWAIS
jgi:hypothetical protein